MRTSAIPEEQRGLRCQCGGDYIVVDSRPSLNSIRRRRRCEACRVKVTTYEIQSPGEESRLKLVEALQLHARVEGLSKSERMLVLNLIAVFDRRATELDVLVSGLPELLTAGPIK